jgi:hypothetical protein
VQNYPPGAALARHCFHDSSRRRLTASRGWRIRDVASEAPRIGSPTLGIVRAMDIWSKAARVETTPAEVYLRIHRRVEIPPGPSGLALRFHPACPFGDARHPCLSVLVRNIVTDKPQAVVRTVLNPEGTAHRINGKTARGRVELGGWGTSPQFGPSLPSSPPVWHGSYRGSSNGKSTLLLGVK